MAAQKRTGQQKLPAIQFYPGDWRKDPGVQALSFHDRGIWFEILCLLHESEDRGKLLLNGQPMPDDALARLLGLDKQVLTTALTNLLNYGVASRDTATGALMNRRMVRDEELRKTRSECGKLGGNPALLKQSSKQKATTGLKQNPTPSVSSSSSSSPSGNNPLNPPSNFVPPTLEEAVKLAAGMGVGVPEDFARKVWHEHDGTDWSWYGKPITNWRSYVKMRFTDHQSRVSERRTNYRQTRGPDTPRSEAPRRAGDQIEPLGDAK